MEVKTRKHSFRCIVRVAECLPIHRQTTSTKQGTSHLLYCLVIFTLLLRNGPPILSGRLVWFVKGQYLILNSGNKIQRINNIWLPWLLP